MRRLNKKYIIIILFILIAYLLRLAFSINTEFWYPDEDVLQIYLIGLKFFTTGAYPYFGADLVYTNTQIPGGLLGILVGTPFFIFQLPEAPHLLLNLLIVLSCALLCWYISKRVDNFPIKILWVWVFFTSWSICYFTRIVNPSYVVPAAILFWISIFEIYPFTKKGILNEKLCFFLLGFSFFWIFQLHLSFVLLVPYILLAFFYIIKSKKTGYIINRTIFFIFGSLVSGSFLIPTIIKYGFFNNSSSNISSNIQLHIENLKYFVDYLIKYLAYACFDITRFIGNDNPQRLQFLIDYLWASPFIILLGLFGVVQLIGLIILFFSKKNTSFKWQGVKYLFLSAYIFMLFSSIFSVATPGGHTTVLLFPLVILYSAHCFSTVIQKKLIRSIVWVMFIFAFISYFAIALNNNKNYSMYKNREIIEKAIEYKDYKLIGKRRYEK